MKSSNLAAGADLAAGPAKTPDPSKSGVGSPVVAIDSDLLRDVPVRLEAKLGEVNMSIGDLLALKAGAVVSVDKRLDEMIELQLNGVVVALGEIVAVGDSFGIRVTTVAQLP